MLIISRVRIIYQSGVLARSEVRMPVICVEGAGGSAVASVWHAGAVDASRTRCQVRL